MSENVLDQPVLASASERPRAFDTIVLGGLVVAILDLLFAFTYYGAILAVPKMRIFQTVAGGLLGPTAAYAGGVKTFVLGLFLHLIVAICIATVYYLLSSRLAILIQHPFVSGLLYGAVAYFGMKLIVVPLSAIGRRPLPRLSILVPELLGHMFLVGLPLGLLAARSAKRNR